MVDVKIPSNMWRVLAAMELPSVTNWNRLEGRPRTHAFDRSLRGEVRDALWMLARQWQVGEFQADDAGSPVLAQMRMDHTRITKVRLGTDPVEGLVDPLPIEARVERLPLTFVRSGRPLAPDPRLILGRRWLKSNPGVGKKAAV